MNVKKQISMFYISCGMVWRIGWVDTFRPKGRGFDSRSGRHVGPLGLGGVVGLTLPMARADRGSRPVYYIPCSDLGQVVNLSLSVA